MKKSNGVVKSVLKTKTAPQSRQAAPGQAAVSRKDWATRLIEKMRKADELREKEAFSEEGLETIFETDGSGSMVMDRDGDIHWIARGYYKMTNISLSDSLQLFRFANTILPGYTAGEAMDGWMVKIADTLRGLDVTPPDIILPARKASR